MLDRIKRLLGGGDRGYWAGGRGSSAPSRFYRTIPTEEHRADIQAMARQDAEAGIPSHTPPPQPPRVHLLLRTWAPDAMDRDLAFRVECEGLLHTIRRAGTDGPVPDAKGPQARRRRDAELAIEKLSQAVAACKTDINTIGQMALIDVEIYRSELILHHKRGPELAEGWEEADLSEILPSWVSRPTDEIVEGLVKIGVSSLGGTPDGPSQRNQNGTPSPGPAGEN